MDERIEPSDETLVLQSKDGSLQAFNTLVERYQVAVYNLCVRLLGNREAAEDATQEAFLSAYRAIARFDGGNLRAWLLRIAANQCKDEFRRQKRKYRADSLEEIFGMFDQPVEVSDTAETPSERAERAEIAHALQNALMELPFDQRRAIVLVDVMGYQYDEVAEMCDTSTGTIKSRIHRARDRLRAIVHKDPELFGRTERLDS
jgi:RNA polymerase sigma-70 factor, ECF subfamily